MLLNFKKYSYGLMNDFVTGFLQAGNYGEAGRDLHQHLHLAGNFQFLISYGKLLTLL
jgi:hypothetical protein